MAHVKQKERGILNLRCSAQDWISCAQLTIYRRSVENLLETPLSLHPHFTAKTLLIYPNFSLSPLRKKKEIKKKKGSHLASHFSSHLR